MSRRLADSRVATAPPVAGVVSPSQEPRSRTSHRRKIGARWWSRYVTARSPSISSSREGETRASASGATVSPAAGAPRGPPRAPRGGRLLLLLRQLALARADVLERAQLDLLEADHLLGHEHLALLGEVRGVVLVGQALEDPDALRADRVGEVVHLHALDVGDLLLVLPPVQLLHLVRLALDEVDRLRVDRRERAPPVHLGDDLAPLHLRGVARGRVEHEEVVARDRAERDVVRRVRLGRPVPAVARVVEDPLVPATGSSNAAHLRWLARMKGLSGFTRACSGGVPNRYSGCVTMNWSSGALLATKTAAEDPERRPARPACCQSEAIAPGYPASTATSRWPMSTPSSSAFVETTPSTSPSRSPFSTARRRVGGEAPGEIGRAAR